MKCEHKDNTCEFWPVEEKHLRSIFNRAITPLIEENDPSHYSLFALAPQPLLILLGSLFTDKIQVEVYQPHREPATWKWQMHPDDFHFIIKEPSSCNHQPALIFSFSDHVDSERIRAVMGMDVSIWEITTDDCHNDFIKSQAQLSMFRHEMRKLMVNIKSRHGNTTPLHIFPVMPASCAVELGRIRMPKADMPWVIYDHSNDLGKFIKTIEISGGENGQAAS
jgi:hypothetical protein